MPRRWPPEELDAVRTQPLEPIARQLGYRQDPRDCARWKRPGPVLSINAPAFRPLPGYRRRRRLRPRHAPKRSFAEAASIRGPQPRIPEPCKQRWPTIREYLVDARAIPTRILDACKRRGILCADRRQNAVFLCTNARRQTTGAEILGTPAATRETPFTAMARGSRKASGAFWIPASNQAPDTVFLAETPSKRSPPSRSRKRPKAPPSSYPPPSLRPPSHPGSKHGNQAGSSAHMTQTTPEIKTPVPSPNTIQGSNASEPKAQETGTKSSSETREQNHPQQFPQTIRPIPHPLP